MQKATENRNDYSASGKESVCVLCVGERERRVIPFFSVTLESSGKKVDRSRNSILHIMLHFVIENCFGISLAKKNKEVKPIQNGEVFKQ